MASATAAEEALRATKRKENFQRLTRLLMCGGVRLLREKFDSIHPPNDLPGTLDDTGTRDLLKKANLFKEQRDCLYPSPGTFGKSTDFDITLMFKLFRTICNLTEPVNTGWNNPPNSTDHSLEADLVRIKNYRNSVHAHNSKMEITDSEFCTLWNEISESLLRIAGSMGDAKRCEWKKAIDELLTAPLTREAERYLKDLQSWYKNDMDVLKHEMVQVGHHVQQVDADVKHLQQVNLDIRDQFQQVNDQLQKQNQTLGDLKSLIINITGESSLALGQPPPTESYIWKTILSPAFDLVQSLVEYLRNKLAVRVIKYRVGSLLITVTCSSFQILEGLWKDYSSGHLNKVVEQTLVTRDVLEKLGLSELKLKTTISEEEYNKCKEFFLNEHQSHETSGNVEDEEKEDQEQDGEQEEKKENEEVQLQLRNELMNYDFHKSPRINKDAFQDLVVDDIDLIRIAVIGPAGAGKTSLVGTLQRALKKSQTAADPDLERCEGTVILEEHYVQEKIRVVDTRGFCVSDERLEDELLGILFGRLRPGDEIVRSYDKEGDREQDTLARRATDLSEYVHAVIFVVDANDPHLKDGKYRDKLQNIREHLSQEGYVPVTAITFLDKLTLKEKDAAYKMAQRTTGSFWQTTFFITNYTSPEHGKTSCEIDRAALDILDSTLLSAERFIQSRKQREKNQLEKEIKVEGAPSDRETVQQFLARVGKKHNWTDQGSMKAVLTGLSQKEIHVVKVLKALWEDIKSELQLLIGSKIDLEEELKRM